MPPPQAISQNKQLLVEGRDAKEFFSSFLRHLGTSNIQIQDFGGINDLRPFLKAFRNEPGFERNVQSLGIIRDAEMNPQGAFQSARDALSAAGLPVPKTPEEIDSGPPKTSILILPNSSTRGMLETLCLESVSTDPVLDCVNSFFTCAKQQLSNFDQHSPKARLHAFLSTKPKPDLLVGQAANAGYFPWDHQSFEHVRNFLQNL